MKLETNKRIKEYVYPSSWSLGSVPSLVERLREHLESQDEKQEIGIQEIYCGSRASMSLVFGALLTRCDKVCSET
jgi:hypothetical protein